MRVILAVEVLFLFACAYVSVCVLGGVCLCVCTSFHTLLLLLLLFTSNVLY